MNDDNREEIIKYPGTKKSVTPDDIERKVFGENPGHVLPELSPKWNFDLGMLESNSKPVRMFEPIDKKVVARKWTVKD
jgi:hypothetical protein